MAALTPRSRPPFRLSAESSSLAKCEELLTTHNFVECLRCAQQLGQQLANDSGTSLAWAYSAWSLFQLKRYQESKQAIRTALAQGIWDHQEQRAMYDLAKACDLIPSLEKTAGWPGKALRDGWYTSRLQCLIREGRLQAPGGGTSDCSVIADDVDEWVQGKRDVVFCVDDGERNVDPGIFHKFPASQSTGGVVHYKNRAFHFHCTSSACYQGKGPCSRCQRNFPAPVYAFPHWDINAPTVEVNRVNPHLDVFVINGAVGTQTHESLRACLDDIADRRKDFPLPKYQNIIDPNVGSVDGVWVPTDVAVSALQVPRADQVKLVMLLAKMTSGRLLPSNIVRQIVRAAGAVSELGTCSLASPIPDLHPHKNHKLYLAVTDVLTAALPALAQIKRPALLLPGPLQVVMKAQSIYLAAGEDYTGIWHQDGLRESIVAVVLYYYRASATLQGGALEFIARDSFGLDCVADYMPRAAKALVDNLPRCQVPVTEGTMIVFSNYSTVHRVLPILAGAKGSRDFLAFFVVDQRAPLQSPDLGPVQERWKQRKAMLREQLQPRGQFGADASTIYSTGNGCPADFGWVSSCARNPRREEGLEQVACLNAAPPLGRGVSYFLQDNHLPSRPLNVASEWEEHRIGPTDDSALQRRVFVNHVTHAVVSVLPPNVNNLSGVCHFKDHATWQTSTASCFWPADDVTRQHLEGPAADDP